MPGRLATACRSTHNSTIQGPFLVSFEDGAPVIVDEPAFHFSNVSAVAPTRANSTSNQHDGLRAVVSDLGWDTGNGTIGLMR